MHIHECVHPFFLIYTYEGYSYLEECVCIPIIFGSIIYTFYCYHTSTLFIHRVYAVHPIFNCAMHPFVKWNVIENCGYFTFIHATIRVNDLPKLEKPWQLEEVPTLQCYCMR